MHDIKGFRYVRVRGPGHRSCSNIRRTLTIGGVVAVPVVFVLVLVVAVAVVVAHSNKGIYIIKEQFTVNHLNFPLTHPRLRFRLSSWFYSYRGH